MTNAWFAMITLGMLGGASNARALAPTVAYMIALLMEFPNLDYALEFAALYVVALVVASFRS